MELELYRASVYCVYGVIWVMCFVIGMDVGSRM